MATIGFICAGHIAAPMARCLARKGHAIHVTRRSEAVSAALQADFGAHVGTPQAVIDAAETMILCLRPDVAAGILEPLVFRPGQTVISVMAGLSRATLAALCAPATQIIRTIPIGFLETGGCPLATHGDPAPLAALFEPENPVVPVADEAAFNAHFAACTLAPAVLDLLQTSADWLALRTGDAGRAEFFVAQFLAGFLGALERDRPGMLTAERDALATDGTLSKMMIEGLRADGVHTALRTAMDRIETRLEGG